jgi:hypothetical protein
MRLVRILLALLLAAAISIPLMAASASPASAATCYWGSETSSSTGNITNPAGNPYTTIKSTVWYRLGVCNGYTDSVKVTKITVSITVSYNPYRNTIRAYSDSLYNWWYYGSVWYAFGPSGCTTACTSAATFYPNVILNRNTTRNEAFAYLQGLGGAFEFHHYFLNHTYAVQFDQY